MRCATLSFYFIFYFFYFFIFWTVGKGSLKIENGYWTARLGACIGTEEAIYRHKDGGN
jgi:hypothetical protein